MNIRVPKKNITDNSIVIMWDPLVDLFPVDYILRWYGEDGINKTVTIIGSSHTVAGLTSNTSYRFLLFANNTCCGAGPVSEVITVKTNAKPPATSNNSKYLLQGFP